MPSIAELRKNGYLKEGVEIFIGEMPEADKEARLAEAAKKGYGASEKYVWLENIQAPIDALASAEASTPLDALASAEESTPLDALASAEESTPPALDNTFISGNMLDRNGAIVEKTDDGYRVVRVGHPQEFTYMDADKIVDPEGDPRNAVKYARTSDGKVWEVIRPLAVAVRKVKTYFLFIPTGSREEGFILRGRHDLPEGVRFMLRGQPSDDFTGADSIIVPDAKGRDVTYSLLRPYAAMYRDIGRGRIDYK